MRLVAMSPNAPMGYPQHVMFDIKVIKLRAAGIAVTVQTPPGAQHIEALVSDHDYDYAATMLGIVEGRS